MQKKRIKKKETLDLVSSSFLFLIFGMTVLFGYGGYQVNSGWNIGDWLINYQGGMIRRGLLGEVIYQSSNIFNINIGLLVFLLQIFFYGIFFSLSYFLIKKQSLLLPYTLLIFSPFLYTFQVYIPDGGFRKEIIYFAILTFIVWSAKTKKYETFENIFFVVLLFYPAVILTHEMLAVFLPYIVAVYAYKSDLTRKKFFQVVVLLLFSVVSFFVALYYSGTTEQVIDITNSLANKNYPIYDGIFKWLGKGFDYGILQVKKALDNNHYSVYPVYVILASIAYIPILNRIREVAKNKFALSLIVFSLMGSLVLFAVAIDWGRFIYIHLVSIFLISLLPEQEIKMHKMIQFKKPIVKLLMILLVVSYAFFWFIPYAGGPLEALSQRWLLLQCLF